MIEIKSYKDGKVLYTAENASDVKTAVEQAVKEKVSLRSADLRYADLRYADLRSADLSSADLSSADLRYADLRYADLRSADLRYADLRSADLSSADLRSADLSSADLSSADLRSADLSSADHRDPLWAFRVDFFDVLDRAPAEVAGVREALVAGKVNGSTYSGECSCLVGTIATARGVSMGEVPDELEGVCGLAPIKPDSSRPAEAWFLAIREGDTPDGDTEGAYRARVAVEWIDEWVATRGAAAKVLTAA